MTLLACSSLIGCGGMGGSSVATSPGQQTISAAASSASQAASQSQTANTSISTAVSSLAELVTSNPALSTNSTVAAAAATAQQAVNLATTAQSTAAAAAADLLVASNVTIVGVVSAGRTICAAANSCTKAEISALTYKAAETAKNAAEASLFAITAANQLKSSISTAAPNVNVSAATNALSAAQTAAATAQTSANQAISNYSTASSQIGTSVTTISPSTGTTGSIAGTPTYSGDTQTIVTTYGDGTKSTATYTATSSAVTWAADHITKTTTYSYANGGTNSVVATVPGTAGTPTYSGNTQTIVTTYGDGTTSTANNTATGSTVAWAADHVTKTTTYTYANGGTNSVIATVPGTAGTPTYRGNTQTIVTTYGDGTTSTANNTATGSTVAWAADHVTKTTTYTYANGGTNSVVATVPGTVSGATLSNTNGIVSVSPLVTTYGDGFSVTTEDGTSTKPFAQATLVTKSITDSNSHIQSSTTSYDLRWGLKATPFALPASDDVAAQISSTTKLIDFVGVGFGTYPTFTLNQGFSFTGSLGATTSNFQGVWITPDVKAAWAEGWTGKNVKVGIIDDFTANGASDFRRIPLSTGCGYVSVLGTPTYQCSTSSNAFLKLTHGEQVSMITGGSINQLNGLITEAGTWTDGFDLGTYLAVQNLAVNLSSPFYGIAKDASIYRNDFLTYQSNTNGLFSQLKNWGTGTDASSVLFRSLQVVNLSLGGTSTNRVINQAVYALQLNYANASIVSDTVFVKAAGNESCVISSSNCDPNNPVFYNSPQYKNKSIIVGALNQAGGSIASYSNQAGAYSDRFLVADGRGIYDSTAGTYVQGTSFAAPRVAGYAAILRQKFPNLNAEKSSSILLDTARYDTLSCNPNCPSNIYGMGEASLSRALAPVGRLR